jgi:hypothetical protein
MDGLIEDHDLSEELEERLIEETGNTNFYLGFDEGEGGLDEDSDQEDPELELRKALDEKNSLIEAVTGALENRAVATELERSRMQMEDFRAQLFRNME